jgi:hypothetical protein
MRTGDGAPELLARGEANADHLSGAVVLRTMPTSQNRDMGHPGPGMVREEADALLYRDAEIVRLVVHWLECGKWVDGAWQARCARKPKREGE